MRVGGRRARTGWDEDTHLIPFVSLRRGYPWRRGPVRLGGKGAEEWILAVWQLGMQRLHVSPFCNRVLTPCAEDTQEGL